MEYIIKLYPCLIGNYIGSIQVQFPGPLCLVISHLVIPSDLELAMALGASSGPKEKSRCTAQLRPPSLKASVSQRASKHEVVDVGFRQGFSAF